MNQTQRHHIEGADTLLAAAEDTLEHEDGADLEALIRDARDQLDSALGESDAE